MFQIFLPGTVLNSTVRCNTDRSDTDRGVGGSVRYESRRWRIGAIRYGPGFGSAAAIIVVHPVLYNKIRSPAALLLGCLPLICLLLGCLPLDIKFDILFQHLKRYTSLQEHRIVKGSYVELFAKLLFGPVA